MKKSFFLFCLLMLLTARLFAQKDACLSFDGKTLFYSAPVEGEAYRAIFSRQLVDNVWGEPVRIRSLEAPGTDAMSPSLAPDEQVLYFVRRYPASSRKEEDRTYLMMAHRVGDEWTNVQSLIVSEGADIAPYMLRDGRTLLFLRNLRLPSMRQNQYVLCRMVKLDHANWTDPAVLWVPENKEENIVALRVEERTIHCTLEQLVRKEKVQRQQDYLLPDSLLWKPMLTLSGSLTDETGRPTDATLTLRDGITGVTMATYSLHGDYRLALTSGQKYSLDFVSSGTNHHYLDFDLRGLRSDSAAVHDWQFVRQLAIVAHLYDALDNMPLGDEQHLLTIGSEHRLLFHHRAYLDTTIVVDTRNPILLTRSELDITLMPATTEVAIRVVDAESHELLEESVFAARQGRDYPLHFEPEGYMYFDTLLSIPLDAPAMELEVPLLSLKADRVMQIKNIQFEYNSAELKDESFEELDRLIGLLERNRQLTIELAAHTDDQGPDAYNDRLSASRGETVRLYLVEHGVAPERLTSKGYGERMPLVPNDSEEHRAMNRRVEFKVIGL